MYQDRLVPTVEESSKLAQSLANSIEHRATGNDQMKQDTFKTHLQITKNLQGKLLSYFQADLNALNETARILQNNINELAVESKENAALLTEFTKGTDLKKATNEKHHYSLSGNLINKKNRRHVTICFFMPSHTIQHNQTPNPKS